MRSCAPILNWCIMMATDNIIAPRFHDPFRDGGRLGRPTERPETRSEAEARFLRAIRTDSHFERLERRYGGNSKDWPAAYRIEAECRSRLLRACGGKLPGWTREDYDDVHVTYSDLEAIGEKWMPTARDVGDWETGVLKWGAEISRDKWRIMRARAANPPWGFPEIDHRESKYRGWAWRNYQWAIDTIWKAAR